MFHDDRLVATVAVCALPTVMFHSDRRGIFKGQFSLINHQLFLLN
jgi:hypothetical protein